MQESELQSMGSAEALGGQELKFGSGGKITTASGNSATIMMANVDVCKVRATAKLRLLGRWYVQSKMQLASVPVIDCMHSVKAGPFMTLHTEAVMQTGYAELHACSMLAHAWLRALALPT